MVTDIALPKKPERPLDSDCCGQGCVPCVLDVYEDEMKIWENDCQRILSGQTFERTKASLASEVQHAKFPVLCTAGYRKFTIDDITRETLDTARYRFSLPMGVALGLQTGQHIIVRGDVDGHMITRQYTPVTDVNTEGHFDLLIKAYSNGRMSSFIKTWDVGMEVDIRGPYGSLIYQPNMASPFISHLVNSPDYGFFSEMRRILANSADPDVTAHNVMSPLIRIYTYQQVYMLCVGTGIAPMAQVIHSILNNEADETHIHLLYGCRTYGDILLKSEIDEWSRYWNFKCEFFLSQEPQCSSKYRYGETVFSEKISRTTVHSVIKDLQANFLVLICGTRSFELDMITYVNELHIPKDKYHKF